MSRGRKAKYSKDLTFQDYVLFGSSTDSSGLARHLSDLLEAMEKPFQVSPTWSDPLIKDVPLDHLHLSSRARSGLADLRIATIAELMGTRRLDLLRQKRLGLITLEHLRQEVADVLWPPLVGNGQLSGFQSLAEIVGDYVAKTIRNPRKARLAMGRLAPDSHRPHPLREFGEALGLSRERIRQIVDEAFERLSKPAKLVLLGPLWREIWPILQSWDRPVPVGRLAEGLRRRLGWVQTPPDGAVVRLLSFQPELDVQSGVIALQPMNGSR